MTKNIKAFTIIVLLFFLFTLMIILSKKAEENQDNSFSSYKPGIEVIKSLSNSEYIEYIQRVYVHPGEKNKLMILIKPNYWGVLSEEDKKEITSKAIKKWKTIYFNSDQEEYLEPEVNFANI